MRVIGTVLHASDRLAAGRAQFPCSSATKPTSASISCACARIPSRSRCSRAKPRRTERLLERFGRVVANWLLIMTRTKKLTFFTAGYAQVSIVFPYVVVSPAYFAGKMQLGGLMQTASAFNSVQTALSFFIECLSLAGGMALGHPAAGWIRAGGGGGARRRAYAAGDRGRGRRRWPRGRTRRRRGEPADRRAAAWHPTTSSCRAASRCWSPGRPARANRRCSGRSRASGRSAPAASCVPKDAQLMMLPQRPYFPVGIAGRGGDLSGGGRQL